MACTRRAVSSGGKPASSTHDTSGTGDFHSDVFVKGPAAHP
ncbi:hypothetical protein [Variovorax paradoxus]|nr:hypothetical protein [Variovorax paradoxus]WPH24060.1 hypothetical protein RZE78_27750 [Variovorax paradoxus]